MKNYPVKFESFQLKIILLHLAKVAKFHTNPQNYVASLTNPYKLSILGAISRSIFLASSSSKYLSFEYLTFSNKRKTAILFPSPLTFLR